MPPSLVTDEIASSVEKMMNISGFQDPQMRDLEFMLLHTSEVSSSGNDYLIPSFASVLQRVEMALLGKSKSPLIVNDSEMASDIQLSPNEASHYGINQHKSEPPGQRWEMRFDVECDPNGLYYASDFKTLMDEFHSQTTAIHSYIWGADLLKFIYRHTHFVNQILRHTASCWLFGYHQYKAGHIEVIDWIPPFSVTAAAMKALDELVYFIGGSVGAHDRRGFWLSNTTISSGIFGDNHIFGRPLARFVQWCPFFDSDSTNGQFKLYDNCPAMDFSHVSNIFLQSCSALHKCDFYNMALLWLDHAQKKGNKHNQQLDTLKKAYSNLIVPHHRYYYLKFDEYSSILNPPASLQKIDHAPFDHYSTFIAQRLDDSIPLTLDDWLQFALKCLELITLPIIAYYSGVQSSRGGRPFATSVTDRFKATHAQYSAHLDDGVMNWEAIFFKGFWEDASDRTDCHSQKDFVDIISRVALSKEQCHTSFPGWAQSEVRTFTFKARHKFPVSLDCQEWKDVLNHIKTVWKDHGHSIVILHLHSTSQRMFEKAFRFWNLI